MVQCASLKQKFNETFVSDARRAVLT